MTSPLTQFANARLLFRGAGTRLSGRDGFACTEGQAYLIQAFLKRRSTPGILDDRFDLPAVNGMPLQWQGYTVSYAPITSAQADVFDSIDLGSLVFDTSAQLPAEVRRDSRAKLSIAGLEVIDVRFADTAGKFGADGIGSILQGVLGDPLFLDGGQTG